MRLPDRPLPEQTILIHVGFHKTGTTALQSAFAAARPRLVESGVLYPGKRSSHHRAAMAATERTWGWGAQGGKAPRQGEWESLVRASTEHEGRVFISSEAFSLANAAAVDRVIERLGADRLHIVMTLRPISRLLPSSYQQYLKFGLTMRYEDWLEQAFTHRPKCPPSPNFWRRNDHVGVAKRWAERLGPDRVSLVVLDESDRGYLFRTFERLLDLPEDMLVPDRAVAKSNRSMSGPEAEMLRRINESGSDLWDWPHYEKLVRRGAVLRMVESRRPAADEPALGTPEWAVHAAQEVGRETIAGFESIGVNVYGDLATLADPIPAGQPPTDDIEIPVTAASQAVLGAISNAMSGLPIRPEDEDSVDRLDLPVVRTLTTRETATLLNRRLREAVRWRVQRARRALRPRRRKG